ncbi:TRZ/ATZ family hydrolase [Thiohalobacter sp. IOR34]|uniref:TRZ/ATZ family hydrolase n=1 Tax=Thiohalobacter sp. IOR34 TaxID=3057176 RepID=UPI0025AF50E7|nr:TRZ/ATZ family hydrolase [Thiohalobacter sp. IOR34]WJW76661.1 TRZ/ATZ family hydrolase [Thiohalobacter sp. IOR34]
MQAIDTLIKARWIIPVEPDHRVLEEHALAIDEGRILDVLPAGTASERYRAETRIELPQHALIPGLVNAHTHAAMSLLRGLADDLPLMTWLNEHIWPAEQRWINEEFIHDGSQLAIAEMLRGGITCFNDMYFFPEVTARVAAAAGMRTCVGLILIDFPTAYAAGPDDYLDKGLVLHDEYRNDPLIHTAFAPHAPYTVSDGPLQRLRVLADELDIPIHMHVHETRDEVHQSLQQHGRRPLQRLDDLGLLSPALTAVHMTQLQDEEIEHAAATGIRVVHCPESNLKLASGFCPVQRLLEAGIEVALGTDGAASNNDLDLFGEMRSAALLGKAVAADASALPAHQVLRMATLNGARALGLGEETGSLRPGKWADLCAVDLGRLETSPCYHPVSQLVYASGRHQVSDVWVGGRHLLKEGRLTSLDETSIRDRALHWQTRIAATDPDGSRP